MSHSVAEVANGNTRIAQMHRGRVVGKRRLAARRRTGPPPVGRGGRAGTAAELRTPVGTFRY